MRRAHWLTLAVVVLVALAGCTTDPTASQPSSDTASTTAPPDSTNPDNDSANSTSPPTTNERSPTANESAGGESGDCNCEHGANDTEATTAPPSTTETPPTTAVTTTASLTTTTTAQPTVTTTAPTATTTTATTTPPSTTTATTTPPPTTTASPTTTTTQPPTTSTTTSPTTTQPPTTTTTPSAPTDPDDPGDSSYETEQGTITASGIESLIHQRVNELRSQRGRDQIGFDATVASVARAHSEDMAERDYFAHTNPDGEQPWDRYGDVAESPCRTFGENIAMRTVGPSATEESVANRLVDMWMGSSGHRQNILSSAWNEEGIGVYVTDGGAVYATQNFCG